MKLALIWTIIRSLHWLLLFRLSTVLSFLLLMIVSYSDP